MSDMTPEELERQRLLHAAAITKVTTTNKEAGRHELPKMDTTPKFFMLKYAVDTTLRAVKLVKSEEGAGVIVTYDKQVLPLLLSIRALVSELEKDLPPVDQ